MHRNGDDSRVGVYVCHCGSNIAGKVDVHQLAAAAEEIPGVVIAREYAFMCSDPGQKLIKADIEEYGLERVVVASCSPRLHEHTFRHVCFEAGINPYNFQMANIREQVSWVTADPDEATRKAIALVKAAVHRVKLHEALETREAPVEQAVLVVGAGISGIQASLEIADAGHKVYLVERESSIGGQMARFDKTFPTLDCAACILTPKMVAIRQHENIELMTWSEVEEVSGSIGAFKIKIRNKARGVDLDLCTGCNICVEKCPYKTASEFDEGIGQRKAIFMPFPQAVPNVPVIDHELCQYYKTGKCQACVKFCEAGAIDLDQTDSFQDLEVGAVILTTGFQPVDAKPIGRYGYGKVENVVTAMELERMVNAAGPTGGRILKRDGKAPRSVGIIHCVGSRDKATNEYCSKVCCMYSMKFAHLVKEKTGAEVYNFYIDIRAAGKGYEEFYNRVQGEGTHFVRGRVAEVTNVAREPEEEGKAVIQVFDSLLGKQRRIPVDMVVLATGLEPRSDAPELARKFNVNLSQDGFFMERHPKLDPFATMSDGVFVAGCAQGPKDIPDSVAQGSAAAARAVGLLNKGAVTLEATTAEVVSSRCVSCRICNVLCPYTAIGFDPASKVSVINETLCKGCGTCVAACPVGAIKSKHFTEEQIFAEIEGVLA